MTTARTDHAGKAALCQAADIKKLMRNYSAGLFISKVKYAETGDGFRLDWPIARQALWRDGSGERHQTVIVPIGTGFRGRTSKGPEPDTFVLNLSEVRKISHGSIGIQSQSRKTVEKMLRRIIGRISDERLRIDHQPWLTLGPHYVARV
jgi:hypothetical protein